jgi:putative endonuclease
MGSDHRKPLGKRGEDVASAALRGAGYRILEHNYRCPLGEVDIVARKGRTVVFVEVKSESGRRGILPKERVNRRKQAKLTRVAQFYLKQKKLYGFSARFDVVQVGFECDDRPAVDILPNAFEIQE